MAIMYICAYQSEATKLEFCIIRSLYFEVYNNKVKKKCKCLNLCKRVQRAIFALMALTRGARSARADARLCTSSGINLIVPLSFHLVR